MLALSIGEGSSQGFLSLLIPPHHASIPNFPKSIVSHTYAPLACKSNHLLYLRKYRGYIPFSSGQTTPVAPPAMQSPQRKSSIYVSLSREPLRGVAKLPQQTPFATYPCPESFCEGSQKYCS